MKLTYEKLTEIADLIKEYPEDILLKGEVTNLEFPEGTGAVHLKLLITTPSQANNKLLSFLCPDYEHIDNPNS